LGDGPLPDPGLGKTAEYEFIGRKAGASPSRNKEKVGDFDQGGA
jgi:hypothetical protein